MKCNNSCIIFLNSMGSLRNLDYHQVHCWWMHVHSCGPPKVSWLANMFWKIGFSNTLESILACHFVLNQRLALPLQNIVFCIFEALWKLTISVVWMSKCASNFRVHTQVEELMCVGARGCTHRLIAAILCVTYAH